MRSGKRNWFWWVLSLIAVTVLNLPLITAFVTSFKTDADISMHPLKMPSSLTFDHYLQLSNNSQFDFAGFLINSVALSTGAVIVTTAVGLPAAYAVTKLGVGRRLLGFVTSVQIIPAIFLMLPFFIMFSTVGLIDTWTALILSNVVFNIPLVMLIYVAGFEGISASIYDAGRVDGASPLRILISIMVPMVRPTVASAALITFVFSWSEYLFGLVLTTRGAVPLTVGVSNFITNTGTQWGNLSATVVVALIPTLLVAIFAQKHFVRGLAAGAEKG